MAILPYKSAPPRQSPAFAENDFPTRREALLAGLPLGALALLGVRLRAAEDAEPSTQLQAHKQQVLQLMLGKAEQMTVRLGVDDKSLACDLYGAPLIHYSDQVRRLPESTLWLWEHRGLPAVFCKIERVTTAEGATKSWQYCCVPATAEKADVTWGRDFRWRAREFPFRWSPLSSVSGPSNQPRVRLSQMKVFARSFSGKTEQTPLSSQQEMRLLTSPLHQYSSPEQNVVDGCVFGLTSNGTNPDALLLLEALREPEHQTKWRYSVVGMTGDAVEVVHQTMKVWSKPFSDGPGDHRSWMWYISAT